MYLLFSRQFIRIKETIDNENEIYRAFRITLVMAKTKGKRKGRNNKKSDDGPASKEKVVTPPRKENNEIPTKKEQNMEDWITSLARDSVASSSDIKIRSKDERLQRREAKKARRQAKFEKWEEEDARTDLRRRNNNNVLMGKEQLHSDREINKQGLKTLATLIRSICSTSAAAAKASKKRPRPYSVVAERKKKRNKGWDDRSIQPRTSDYGGIGLARESLFLRFQDPSFFPKLEEEFAEHIPGFFGKQRTKAMKRQLDGNMLWRQLAEKKTKNAKVNGVKLSDMTPDERVEAMIKLGMI